MYHHCMVPTQLCELCMTLIYYQLSGWTVQRKQCFPKDPLFGVFLLSMHGRTFSRVLRRSGMKASKIYVLREQARWFFPVEVIINTILQCKPSFKQTRDGQKDTDLLDSLPSILLFCTATPTWPNLTLKSVKTFRSIKSKNTKNACGGNL